MHQRHTSRCTRYGRLSIVGIIYYSYLTTILPSTTAAPHQTRRDEEEIWGKVVYEYKYIHYFVFIYIHICWCGSSSITHNIMMYITHYFSLLTTEGKRFTTPPPPHTYSSMERFLPTPQEFVWKSYDSTQPFFSSLSESTNNLPFSHWVYPTVVPALYLMLTLASNARLNETSKPIISNSILNPICTIHNIILVTFSAICVIGITYDVATLEFLPKTESSSFANAIFELFCPQQFGESLRGRIFWWSYLFYVSKYYELLDTFFIVMKSKRVIPLHLWHHMSVPPIMWAAFQGRLAPALIFVVILNGAVHTVMYFYYALASMGVSVPRSRKKIVTNVQIIQFYIGVGGGTSYLLLYLRNVRVNLSPISLSLDQPGCSGNLLVFGMGFLINLSFLLLFKRFFKKAYNKKKKK